MKEVVNDALLVSSGSTTPPAAGHPLTAGHAAVAKSASGTTVMTTVGVGAGGSTMRFLRSSRASVQGQAKSGNVR